MKTFFKFFLIFFTLFLLSCGSKLKFKDLDFNEPSSWMKFRGDLKNSSFLSQKIEAPKRLLWKKELGGALVSSPVATSGVLILGGLDKKLYFIDAQTGEKQKTFKTSSSISFSPLLEDSILYFSSEKGDGNLYALNLSNGEILWKKDLKDPSTSPLVVDEKIYLGTSDGRFFCLDKISGKVMWFFKTDDIIKSFPAYADGSLFFGSAGGNFYSLDKDSGKEVWRYKTKSAIFSSPAIKKESVFFGCLDGSLYALNKVNGDLLWKFETSGKIFSSPAVDDSTVFIGSNDGYLYAVDFLSGKMNWRFDAKSVIRSSPLIVGNKVFFGSLDGNFYVLDKVNGEPLWSYKADGMVFSPPIFYDGKIYIGTFDGFLYCFGK